MDISVERLIIIVVVALGAHLGVVTLRALGRRLLRVPSLSESKLNTITGFVGSLTVFSIYFAAVGFALSEMGVSLTTYLASATVIGLAVSFGSQGVVQDLITGLTVLFSGLLDVGDMVDIGGQVGIVQRVGMRFTVLINFSGAQVHVPNRSIGSVTTFPKGYIRAFLDARLPADPALHEEGAARLEALAQSAFTQFPGILLLPPTAEAPRAMPGGYAFLRVKFRLWPGQGAVIENHVRLAAIQILKGLDPAYADWMVTVTYRAEPANPEAPPLPRPAALTPRRGSGGASRDLPMK